MDGVLAGTPADFPALSWKEVILGREDAVLIANCLVVWGRR